MKDALREQYAKEILTRTAVYPNEGVGRSKIEYEKGQQDRECQYDHLHQRCLNGTFKGANVVGYAHRAYRVLPLHERTMLHGGHIVLVDIVHRQKPEYGQKGVGEDGETNE